jgi:hypothetical protein
MLTRLSGGIWRCAEKERHAATCIPGRPEVATQWQVALAQCVKLVQRRAPAVIAQRAGECVRQRRAGSDNGIVRDRLGRRDAGLQAVQVGQDAFELLRHQAITQPLGKRGLELHTHHDAPAALDNPDLGIHDPVTEQLANERKAEQQATQAGRPLEESAPAAESARRVVLDWRRGGRWSVIQANAQRGRGRFERLSEGIRRLDDSLVLRLDHAAIQWHCDERFDVAKLAS